MPFRKKALPVCHCNRPLRSWKAFILLSTFNSLMIQQQCSCALKPDIGDGGVRSCTGGKTEDFQRAAQLMHKAGGQVKVPTFLVPATQKVWADVYTLPVAGCEGRTAAQIFEAAGCVAPAAPSCAACLGGPKDTFARLNEPQICVSTTNR